MIREATANDLDAIFEVINDAALAYKGIIPADRWHEPYMSMEELRTQIEEGVKFFCFTARGKICGVMGIQDKTEVKLIRHAYVRSAERKKGIGSELILELLKYSTTPVLVGTWKAAHWAIHFYENHGFVQVGEEEKITLLRKYWNIPDRQVETSVVLVDKKYLDKYSS